jgi:hypothetical protein
MAFEVNFNMVVRSKNRVSANRAGQIRDRRFGQQNRLRRRDRSAREIRDERGSTGSVHAAHHRRVERHGLSDPVHDLEERTCAHGEVFTG